jgi:hypothetical protein
VVGAHGDLPCSPSHFNRTKVRWHILVTDIVDMTISELTIHVPPSTSAFRRPGARRLCRRLQQGRQPGGPGSPGLPHSEVRHLRCRQNSRNPAHHSHSRPRALVIPRSPIVSPESTRRVWPGVRATGHRPRPTRLSGWAGP